MRAWRIYNSGLLNMAPVRKLIVWSACMCLLVPRLVWAVDYGMTIGIFSASRDTPYRLDIGPEATKSLVPANHDSWATRLKIMRLDGPVGDGVVHESDEIGIFSEDGNWRLDIGSSAAQRETPAYVDSPTTRLQVRRLSGDAVGGPIKYGEVVGIFSEDGKYRLDIGVWAMKVNTSKNWDSWATRLKIRGISKEVFTMAFIGDTQYEWDCGEQRATGGEVPPRYCSQPQNQTKGGGIQAAETNQLVISRVKEIAAWNPNFKGLVINGDLTEYGSQNGNLDKFKNAYLTQPNFAVWPGLGNHDYENNVGNRDHPNSGCGGISSPSWNYCGADMMQFLAGWILDNKSKLSAWDIEKYKENFLQGGNQKSIKGSLAYSWRINDFHFVQLNNYPDYHISFTRGYSGGISSWDLDATSSASFINANLTDAINNNRKIILNWHKFDPYNNPSSNDTKNLVSTLDKFATHIKAIFVAHQHSMIGWVNNLVFPASTNHNNEIKVPVIYSGSPIYGQFISADFSNEGSHCKITYSIVETDSTYSRPVNPTPISCD